jgi:hypothetical protein
MLEIPEAYSPFWQIDEHPELKPMILNGITLGFLLNAGTYHLRIRFGPQGTFVAGAAVSLIGLTLTISLLIQPYFVRVKRRFLSAT